jgi:hypothetical protein
MQKTFDFILLLLLLFDKKKQKLNVFFLLSYYTKITKYKNYKIILLHLNYHSSIFVNSHFILYISNVLVSYSFFFVLFAIAHIQQHQHQQQQQNKR